MSMEDKDDIDNMERANLISESSPRNNNNNGGGISPMDIPMCGCLSVKFYQPYFDVDTNDVLQRALQSLFFCRREQNFLNLIGEKPDAYGPCWIATSLVFIIAVSAHLHGWFSSWFKGEVWVYNFNSILTASSMIYSYLFGVPFVVYFILKQYDPKVRFATMFCLFGYSMLGFIPAVALCILPSSVGSWLSLFIAGIVSTLFLLRNLAPIIVATAPKSTNMLMGLVAITQLVFVFCLKLYFFYEK